MHAIVGGTEGSSTGEATSSSSRLFVFHAVFCVEYIVQPLMLRKYQVSEPDKTLVPLVCTNRDVTPTTLL